MSEESKLSNTQDEERARQLVQDIIARTPTCHKSEDDAQMIRKAFELANDAHRGMRLLPDSIFCDIRRLFGITIRSFPFLIPRKKIFLHGKSGKNIPFISKIPISFWDLWKVVMD